MVNVVNYLYYFMRTKIMFFLIISNGPSQKKVKKRKKNVRDKQIITIFAYNQLKTYNYEEY